MFEVLHGNSEIIMTSIIMISDIIKKLDSGFAFILISGFLWYVSFSSDDGSSEPKEEDTIA